VSVVVALSPQTQRHRDGGRDPGHASTCDRLNLAASSGQVVSSFGGSNMPRHAKIPAVYILASRRNGTLYVGVTSDLAGRISLHKQDLIDGFSKKYSVHTLVYYEMHETMDAAIRREKQLKDWRRAWKIRLIEGMNPHWVDLFDEGTGAVLDGPADVRRRH
jgi:putative endonuclease